MKLAFLVAVATLGCGSRSASHPGPPPSAAGYDATRWVPARPTYVLAAPTVREAQRSFRDILDSIGLTAGLDAADLSAQLAMTLTIDPLSPAAIAAIGVDLEGGIAMFSEDLAPTFVVRLAAPDQTQAFFDGLRERGLVTQSVLVDGIEVFTAALISTPTKVSWAVDGSWLWIHATPRGAPDDRAAWFERSHRPQGTAWAADWSWAQSAIAAARPSVVGFLDGASLLRSVVERVPEAIACTQLLSPISRVAISVEGDGKRASGRLALDLGPSAASVAAAILPVPEGFPVAAARAPLVAQWNLDVVALRGWLTPCLKTLGEDLAWLDQVGVRGGRVVLESFDPDDKSGAGAVALDLVHPRYLAAQLDQIPMRSTLERDRSYGPYKGHSLSIPFVATLDYVLRDKLAFAAVGDGLLTRIVGQGGSTPGPLAALDVAPPGLSIEAWRTIFDAVGVRGAKRVVERLVRWNEGHVALTIEGDSLVLSASGTRR